MYQRVHSKTRRPEAWRASHDSKLFGGTGAERVRDSGGRGTGKGLGSSFPESESRKRHGKWMWLKAMHSEKKISYGCIHIQKNAAILSVFGSIIRDNWLQGSGM